MDVLRENIGLLVLDNDILNEWNFPRQEGYLDKFKRNLKYAWHNKGQTAARLAGASIGYLAAKQLDSNGDPSKRNLSRHNIKGRLTGAALGAHVGQYLYNGIKYNRFGGEMRPAYDDSRGFFSYQQ